MLEISMQEGKQVHGCNAYRWFARVCVCVSMPAMLFTQSRFKGSGKNLLKYMRNLVVFSQNGPVLD